MGKCPFFLSFSFFFFSLKLPVSINFQIRSQNTLPLQTQQIRVARLVILLENCRRKDKTLKKDYDYFGILITFIGFDSHGPFRRNYTDTAGGPGGRRGEGVR